MNKDLLPKMKVERVITLFTSVRWICQKETENWIDLQINLEFTLFVDFIIFLL